MPSCTPAPGLHSDEKVMVRLGGTGWHTADLITVTLFCGAHVCVARARPASIGQWFGHASISTPDQPSAYWSAAFWCCSTEVHSAHPVQQRSRP
eukprot:2260978-Prymnesium_polylepis.4